MEDTQGSRPSFPYSASWRVYGIGVIMVAGNGHGVYSGHCATGPGDWTQRRAVENMLKMGHDGADGAIGRRGGVVGKGLSYVCPCGGRGSYGWGIRLACQERHGGGGGGGGIGVLMERRGWRNDERFRLVDKFEA